MTRSLLVLAAMLALAACGGSSGDTTSVPPSTSAVATSVSTTAPASTTTAAAPTSAADAPTPTVTTSSSTTSSSTTSTTLADDTLVIEVAVNSGEVAGESRVSVELGADVRLIVSADVSDEVHIHGYDIYGDVAAGTPATIEFAADIPGIFEVELEGAGMELLELVVGG